MAQTVDMVSVVSGGLDSVTMAYKWKDLGLTQRLISFDYGQKHSKELLYAREQATLLGAEHQVVDLSDIKKLLLNSALTGGAEIPEGHYAEDNMKVTVVPNRNAIMLTIAASYATSIGAGGIATAVHAGDHYQYPDCRPKFLAALRNMWLVSMGGENVPAISAPFLYNSKAEIAREAFVLGVPVEKTWSCYKGGEQHCGRCGTCVERIEAFHLADVKDSTVYVDPDYWVQAVLERSKKSS